MKLSSPEPLKIQKAVLRYLIMQDFYRTEGFLRSLYCEVLSYSPQYIDSGSSLTRTISSSSSIPNSPEHYHFLVALDIQCGSSDYIDFEVSSSKPNPTANQLQV